jgi:excisionase family DNA binding protein
MGDRFLKTRDVAELLGVTVSTLRNWRLRGEGPPVVRMGAEYRYRESAIEAWVQAQQATDRDPT